LPQIKSKALRQLDPDQLRDKLFELRGELSKLRGMAARGMIQKEWGKIRRTKRNIARLLTVMREKGITE
jgi:large subunit ribosomal protein L29